jgi:hypothetical protein
MPRYKQPNREFYFTYGNGEWHHRSIPSGYNLPTRIQHDSHEIIELWPDGYGRTVKSMNELTGIAKNKDAMLLIRLATCPE